MAREQRLLSGVVCLALVTAACVNARPVLTELLEARRLASEMHVQFSKAADAANRAVMGDTDVAAAAAADEATRARQLIERDVETLRPILQSLGYDQELAALAGFVAVFDEYRRLDDEILPLATENTNLKAQRLSFGAAQEAADAFRASIDAVIQSGGVQIDRREALAAQAVVAVLEIQVLQAPHIAAAEDAAMTQMEQRMTASEAAARRAIAGLRVASPAAATPHLTAAVAALDRFKAINDEIVALSRRNSNVRSLALSLGEKRKVTAACDDQLRMLEEALAKHEFVATR
jgi:hypothetical protein